MPRSVAAVGRLASISIALGGSLLLFLAYVAGPSCKSAPTAPAAPVVAPPDSLLAEATLRDPDSFWARVRNGAGGGLLSLPDTAAGVVFGKARLDPRLARLVMGGLPFHVALGEAGDGGLAFAIAMKVRDLGAAQSALGAWDAGAGRAVAGMTLLNPLAGPSAPQTATALSPSGYLVLASSEADLATLGPYAATTLPTKALSTSSIEIRAAAAALAQAGVKAVNLGAWATSNLLGLLRRVAPPAFDSSVFVACVNPLLVSQAAMIGDLQEARLDIDTGDGELHAVATLAPKPGDSAARRRLLAMHPADAAPLLDAPGAATYAVFVSDTAAQRADDAAALGPCIERALGGLLGAEGSATLDGVLAGWARGRGDWDTIADVAGPTSSGLVFHAPVAAADVAAGSLRSLTELAAHPPVSDAIEKTFGLAAGTVQKTDVPLLGPATTLSFPRAAPPGAPPRKGKGPGPSPILPSLGLAWASTAGEIDLAVGESPAELITSVRATPTLGGDVATAQAVRALGSDATFVAVLKPFGCCTTGGPTATPLTFGWGRHGDQGWSRFEMGYGLVARLAGD